MSAPMIGFGAAANPYLKQGRVKPLDGKGFRKLAHRFDHSKVDRKGVQATPNSTSQSVGANDD